jgi:DUF1680 family protein
VDIRIDAAPAHAFALQLRIPAWSEKTVVEVNGKALEGAASGRYLEVRRAWKAGDAVRLRLDVRPRLTMANAAVRDNAGKVAVERGPLVYCMEGIDQASPMWETALWTGADTFSETFRKNLLGGVVEIKAKAAVREPSKGLYERFREKKARPGEVTLIPYYTFANRETTPMQVWLPYSAQPF